VIDLARSTIFVTLAGSHAHGTAHFESDVDLRGICIAPLASRVSYRSSFEQHEGALDGPLWNAIEPRLARHATARLCLERKVEAVVFDIAKFVRLAAEANPNALEVLFADEADWVHSTDAWRLLHGERRRFLSRKVQQTYLGYGMAQLKRIRTHRSWLLNPPKSKPTRTEFGLPDQPTLSHDDRNRIDQAVAEKVRSWAIDELEMPRATRVALADRMREFALETLQSSEESLEEDLQRAASKSLGLGGELIRTLAAERHYRAAVKHWEAYERWKDERNPTRARLEARFGYDTKHAMHLVRLMRTGLELLETGELTVQRPDAAELIAIRDGALSYDDVVAEAERLEARMRATSGASPLAPDVDHAALDALLLELIRREAV
jgi:uncharacterized protein